MASGLLWHVGLGKCSHELHHAAWTSILNDSYESILATKPPHAMRSTTPRYEPLPQSLPELQIKPSPGRGLGLFAVNIIPAYTCVLADDALLSIARGEDLPEIWEKYNLLPAEQRAAFDALAVTDERIASLNRPELVSKLIGRGYDADTADAMARTAFKFQSNAFKTGALPQESVSANPSGSTREKQQQQQSREWAYAIFPTVARVNHSCTPNAHGHYRAASGQQVLFSLREIAAGEELEISYLDLTLPRHARQTRAQDWGFRCECPACSTPQKLRSRSNRSGDGGSGGGGGGGGWRSTSTTLPAYEDRLAIVHECCHATSDLLRGALRSNEHAKQVHDECEQAISIALEESYPWLRTALPKLYETAARIMRAMGDEEARIKSLISCREWVRRLERKIDP